MASAWIGQKAQAGSIRVFVECPKGFGWRIVDHWASMYDMKLGDERVRLSDENYDVCRLDIRYADEVDFGVDGIIKHNEKEIGIWRRDVEASEHTGSSVIVVSIKLKSALLGNPMHI